MKYLALVVLSGCGRLAFDPRSDAGNDGRVVDTATVSDLVVHLPFDTSLFTDVAGSHDAACFGGPCPTLVAGHTGSAVHFDNTNCLQIPFSTDFQLTELTAAAWVRAGAATTDGEVFSRPRGGATSSNNSFEMFLRGTASEWIFCNAVDCTTSPADTTGWHHVALTYGAATLRGYVDGVETTSRLSSSAPYEDDPLVIGCDIDTAVPVAKLEGDIDDVRLYKRALSAAEIAVLGAP